MNTKTIIKETKKETKNFLMKISIASIFLIITDQGLYHQNPTQTQHTHKKDGKTITYTENKYNHIYDWPKQGLNRNELTIENKIEKTKYIDNIGERTINDKNYTQDLPEIINIQKRNKKYTLKLEQLFTKKEIQTGLIKLEKTRDPTLTTLRTDYINKLQQYKTIRKQIHEEQNPKVNKKQQRYDIRRIPTGTIRKEKIIKNT